MNVRVHPAFSFFFWCSIISVFSFLLYTDFIETGFYVPANTTRQISFRLQRFVWSISKPATVSLGENNSLIFFMLTDIYENIYKYVCFAEIRNFGMLLLLI